MNDPRPIGELISELAQTWDPQLEADAQATASFVQGMLAGTVMSGKFLKTASVEQHKNADGNYENYFVIVTNSGHRIRVTVEPEL